jgi:excisionase family DNA binding protein
MTTADVAAKLSIGIDQVVRLIRAGKLEAVDVSISGRKPRWRISERSLTAFLEQRKSTPPVPASRKQRPSRPKDVIEFF